MASPFYAQEALRSAAVYGDVMSNFSFMRMFRVLLSFLALAICGDSLAVDIEPRKWVMEPSEFADSGFEVSIYTGENCGTSNDIYISIPENFNGARFSSAALQVGEDDGPAILTQVHRFSSPETYYSEDPFSGVSFCLSDDLIDDAILRVAYSKGQVITDMVILNGLNVGSK